MNKGLALIALVLSIVALLVTSRQLWGGQDADPNRRVDFIDQLHKLKSDLTQLSGEAGTASVQLRRIDSRLQALEEGASSFFKKGRRGATAESPALQQFVQALVRQEMDRRLASKPKATAPKAFTAKLPPPKKGTDQKFNNMLNGLIKSASLRGAEINKARNAFLKCRKKLKDALARFNRDKKAQPKRAADARKTQYDRARTLLDRELKLKLSATSFARYAAWKQKERAKATPSYIKTFYGKK